MLENTAKQCIPSLKLGDLSERKMQAVSRIPAVFLTTKNSHKVEPADFDPLSQSPNLLDSTGTAKHRPCVCPCLQLPVNAMSKDLCWPRPSPHRTLLKPFCLQIVNSEKHETSCQIGYLFLFEQHPLRK